MIRKEAEEFFGVDLSDVRIHTYNKADFLAQSINAKAFAYGKDIFFAWNQYNPLTLEGQRLIWHELRHVVHQKAKNEELIQRQVAAAEVATGVIMGPFLDDTAATGVQLRDRLLFRLRSLGNYNYETFFNRPAGRTRILLLPDSWGNARGQTTLGGAVMDNQTREELRQQGHITDTMAQVLGRMNTNAFVYLRDLIVEFNITEIDINSLYRSQGQNSPHHVGRGIDIGYVTIGGNQLNFHNGIGRDDNQIIQQANFPAVQVGNFPTDETATALRMATWSFNRNYVSQVIGPWRMRLNATQNFILNNNSNGLHHIHRNHLHITIQR